MYIINGETILVFFVSLNLFIRLSLTSAGSICATGS